MNLIQAFILIVMFIFIFYRFIPVKGIMNITVQQAKEKMINKNVQMIDVRTESEYNTYHDKRFTNIPLAQLMSKLDQLDRESETIVICQSGMRSLSAAKLLKRNGFTNIYNVKGGMRVWS